MCLFSYTQGSINFCIHFWLSFLGKFLRNFQNQGTQPVTRALQSLVDLGTAFFSWAERHPEDGPPGLHQTLPPRGQREAQHDCSVLQHVSGDRGEP